MAKYQKCLNCGSDSPFLFRTKDYNRKATDEEFEHFFCKECDVTFIAPQPKDLSIYYVSDYHIKPTKEFLDSVAVPHEKYKLDILQEHIRGGRLLEIGPSYGCFTYMAKNAGFSVEAIEMNEDCCRYLNETIGIRAHHSINEVETLKSLGQFDVACMWHVIEHLRDPWAILETLSSSLGKGGVLVIAAPNPSAFQFKLMKEKWPHVDAPRHLFLISSKNLISYLEKRGFRLERSTTSDKGSLGWNKFGWEQYFANLVNDGMLKRIMRRLGGYLAKLFDFYESIEGKGAGYTLVFRKQ